MKIYINPGHSNNPDTGNTEKNINKVKNRYTGGTSATIDRIKIGTYATMKIVGSVIKGIDISYYFGIIQGTHTIKIVKGRTHLFCNPSFKILKRIFKNRKINRFKKNKKLTGAHDAQERQADHNSLEKEDAR